VFTGRTAIWTGIGIILVAVIYWYLNSHAGRTEMAGVTMLAILGVAMGVTFYVVFRNSGEL
jgi:hypothetical protein